MTARWIFRVLRKVEETILAWGIILMAALSVLNVFSRTVLDSSLAFAEELSQFLIILVTFVGLSFAAGCGRHIRMTAIYDQLGPRWRKALMILIATTTSLLMFLLAWHALGYVLRVRELGTVSPALQVPVYLVYLAAPVGFALAGVQYALTALKNVRAEGVYLSHDKLDEYEPLEAVDLVGSLGAVATVDASAGPESTGRDSAGRGPDGSTEPDSSNGPNGPNRSPRP